MKWAIYMGFALAGALFLWRVIEDTPALREELVAAIRGEPRP